VEETLLAVPRSGRARQALYLVTATPQRGSRQGRLVARLHGRGGLHDNASVFSGPKEPVEAHVLVHRMTTFVAMGAELKAFVLAFDNSHLAISRIPSRSRNKIKRLLERAFGGASLASVGRMIPLLTALLTGTNCAGKNTHVGAVQPAIEKAFANHGDECCVCMEPFRNARQTSCLHVFCEECIVATVRILGSCPTCRRGFALNTLVLALPLYADRPATVSPTVKSLSGVGSAPPTTGKRKRGLDNEESHEHKSDPLLELSLSAQVALSNNKFSSLLSATAPASVAVAGSGDGQSSGVGGVTNLKMAVVLARVRAVVDASEASVLLDGTKTERLKVFVFCGSRATLNATHATLLDALGSRITLRTASRSPRGVPSKRACAVIMQAVDAHESHTVGPVPVLLGDRSLAEGHDLRTTTHLVSTDALGWVESTQSNNRVGRLGSGATQIETVLYKNGIDHYYSLLADANRNIAFTRQGMWHLQVACLGHIVGTTGWQFYSAACAAYRLFGLPNPPTPTKFAMLLVNKGITRLAVRLPIDDKTSTTFLVFHAPTLVSREKVHMVNWVRTENSQSHLKRGASTTGTAVAMTDIASWWGVTHATRPPGETRSLATLEAYSLLLQKKCFTTK
jgi:hypothetical protein